MELIIENIKGIMLASGVLTMTMLYAALAPQAALKSMFGTALEGPIAEVVVRNWGALIALVGVMLIYGAFDPAVRVFALIVGGASKLIFISLVISQGGRFLTRLAGVAVIGDAAMVALFTAYLAAASA